MPWPNRAPDWPLEIIVFGPLAQADSVAGLRGLEPADVISIRSLLRLAGERPQVPLRSANQR
jgi:hypothetical protein